jgi:hypothetical protein
LRCKSAARDHGRCSSHAFLTMLGMDMRGGTSEPVPLPHGGGLCVWRKERVGQR